MDYTLKVEWGMYGCESGCDGHTATFYDEDGREEHSHWMFTHFSDTSKETVIKETLEYSDDITPDDCGVVTLSDDSAVMGYDFDIHRYNEEECE